MNTQAEGNRSEVKDNGGHKTSLFQPINMISESPQTALDYR